MIEVWYGTPNEMTKAAAKDGQPAAVRWACTHLDGLKPQARKFDNAALAHIERITSDMRNTANIIKGDRRAWEFPYIGATFRIELRST